MAYIKKSLGQNFLIDLNIIKKIINLTEIKDKHVLEVGPGKGALTEEILNKKPKSLILVEKDNLLADALLEKYKNNKKIKVYKDDFLKFNVEKNITKNTIIFGNLPYNVASQILVKFIKFKEWPPKYLSLIFMFQKEMADRIIGKFGSSKYGRLSILTNYRLKHLSKFDISPNCFFPKPKVESTVLHLIPKNHTFHKIKNIDNLEKITNILFSSRRKMINKSIKKVFNQNQSFNSIVNLNLSSRPAELEPDKYYEITELFEKSY